MLKIDKKWCSKCRKYIAHKYIGSEGEYEGLGLGRVLVALASFGISETFCRNKYWQCSRCGKIRED